MSHHAQNSASQNKRRQMCLLLCYEHCGHCGRLKKKTAKCIIDQILNPALLIIFKRKTLFILGSE